jgi:transposase
MERIKLDVRIYECSNYDLIIDRDHNAALNILKLGSEGTLIEKEPLFVKNKQASYFDEA